MSSPIDQLVGVLSSLIRELVKEEVAVANSNASTRSSSGDMLTLKEAAARWRVSESFVRKKINAGHLPAHKVGRSVRIPSDAGDAWVRTKNVLSKESDDADRVGQILKKMKQQTR